jgi:hypothetical protein
LNSTNTELFFSLKLQKLKHSVYSTARKISREVGTSLGMEFEPDVLDLIAELSWRKLTLYASDLEAFQKCRTQNFPFICR